MTAKPTTPLFQSSVCSQPFLHSSEASRRWRGFWTRLRACYAMEPSDFGSRLHLNGVLRRMLLLTMGLMLCSCVSVKLNNSKRLMARPDFPAAATAAPEWVRDSLKTINLLEHGLEKR